MPDTPFKLGMFARAGQTPFLAFVEGDDAIDVAHVQRAQSAVTLSNSASLDALLEDWDRSYAALQALAELVAREGKASDRLRGGVASLSTLRVLPPVRRPSKILNAAANYAGHVAEMRNYTLSSGNVDPNKIFKGEKARAYPYLFLKAPSALSGAYDDIVLPSLEDQVDWEVELAAAIAKRCRRVKAERALDVVAGYMTFNDVSCRTQLFREDRPNIRTDWLASKSHDTFAPLGPFFVPRPFIANHRELRIELKVNGETKQDGRAGEMIFSAEEQIEFASSFMTLEPGDIFATGTVAGVGQGQGKFLKPGDIVEAEVHGLGRQRNRVVGPAA